MHSDTPTALSYKNLASCWDGCCAFVAMSLLLAFNQSISVLIPLGATALVRNTNKYRYESTGPV
eukprot:3699-Heterococcus_DN1.PRE.2